MSEELVKAALFAADMFAEYPHTEVPALLRQLAGELQALGDRVARAEKCETAFWDFLNELGPNQAYEGAVFVQKRLEGKP